MGGVVDSELGGLGATLYEVATMPEFTGTSIAKTPTYKSGKAQKVALEAAFSLECCGPYEMLSLTSAAVDIMDEDAPGLSELIERSSRSILGEGFSDSDLHRIKSGASAARTLHITAEHRMAGGTLDDIS